MRHLLIFESFKEVEKLDLAIQIFIHWKIKKYISKLNLFKGSVSDAGKKYVFFYKKTSFGTRLVACTIDSKILFVNLKELPLIKTLRADYYRHWILGTLTRTLERLDEFTTDVFKKIYGVDEVIFLQYYNSVDFNHVLKIFNDKFGQKNPSSWAKIREKGIVRKLIDWLDKGNEETKLDFLVDIGKFDKSVESRNGKVKYLYSLKNSTGEPEFAERWRGYFSVFFAKAKKAGIIDYKKVGKSTHLVKGENFDVIKQAIKGTGNINI